MNFSYEKLVEEKACSAALLNKWRRQLLIDQAEGDADAIELDRRVLDYYLDQYNSTAAPIAIRGKHSLTLTDKLRCR